MKKSKKKLPKYDIGKRPINLGYLTNKGIGTLVSSTPGYNLYTDVKTLKDSQTPYAFSKASGTALNLLYSLQNTVKIPKYTTQAISTSLLPSITTGPVNTGLKGSAYFTGNALRDIAGSSTGGKLLSPTAMMGQATVLNGTLNILNGVGVGLSAIGALKSGIDIAGDIANEGDTISTGQIASSRGVNQYTTERGNSYTEKTGPDGGAALEYDKQLAAQKKTSLMTNAMGFGASAGALAGSILPGVGNVVGSILGTALGALGGGFASLVGFGDNEDTANDRINLVADVTGMENRLSKTLADNLDARAAFAGRESAANGKRPVWTPAGLVGKKATARVSNGELIGNFADGTVTRVPGLKNNKDTKLAALKNSDFVISNKYGLSDYAAATGDYAGALGLLEMLMGMRNSKGYKNGKLPGFKFGWDSALSVLPHIMSFATNQSLYNRAKNADTYASDTYVDNAEGAKAVDEFANLRYDARPYYTEALRGLNQVNWDGRRQVALGAGGRAILQNANFNQYLNNLAKINALENEANAGYRTAYANALANLGARNQQLRMQSAAQRHQWLLQANAAKENWMAQYLKNRDTSFLNGIAEWLKQGLYKDSLAAQNKMLNIYERLANNDDLKTIAYINSLKGNDNQALTDNQILIQDPIMSYTPKMQLDLVDMNPVTKRNYTNNLIDRFSNFTPRKYGFKNGKLPKCEDGLVDTRSDTTYQGYNPNPIPWGAGLGPAGQGPMALLEGLEAASKISNNPYLLTGIAPSPNKTSMSLKTVIKNNKQRRDIEKVAKKVWTRTNKNKWAEQDAYEPNRYFTNKEHLYLKKKDPKLLLRLEDEAGYQWIMSSGPAAPTFYAPGVKFEDWYNGAKLPINILQK